MEDKSPTRRMTRRRTPTVKSLEYRSSLRSLKIENSGLFAESSSDNSSEENSDNDSTYSVQKPLVLHENEVVHGEEMFKFQNRKTKNAVAQKVAEACAFKTPYKVRKKTKSKIASMLKEDSESEYEISSESTDSDITENESSSSDSDEKLTKHRFKDTKLPSSQSRSRDYRIQTDEYFEKASSKKSVTSNNTLEKLETPRLPQYQLQKLLNNLKLTESHKKAILKLDIVNESSFKKWLLLLNENFNILLYGLGSKRHILHKFQKIYLKDDPVIVINGYFPNLVIKDILDAIVGLLELNENPGNSVEACELIVQKMEFIDTHLYLLINNIEGETLRCGKSQNILARLASIRNIHIVATIDHINAPLIWDHKKLSNFNFIWWDSTTFTPYTEETSFEQFMMMKQSSTLAISSLRNVFASLTSNSKDIYLLIVKYQLDTSKNQYYEGMPFKELYMTCRESFIVSSDLALRAQLTEFVDHKMLKIKRSVDGTEHLLIPLANALLQKFLDEN